MANFTAFSKMLSDVFLGGTIEQCAIFIKKKKARIQAIDLSGSLFIQTSSKIDMEDAQLGIGSLGILNKYIHSIKDSDVSVKLKDNTLIIHPDKGALVKYLLEEMEFIVSYDSEWPSDLIKDELEKMPISIKANQDYIIEFISMMGTFNPNVVKFTVNKKGVISLHGGNETEHQFDVTLGKTKSKEPFETMVYGKHLISVFSAMDFDNNPMIHLGKDKDIVLTTDSSNWMLKPITE